jgi:hypothetical protein
LITLRAVFITLEATSRNACAVPNPVLLRLAGDATTG